MAEKARIAFVGAGHHSTESLYPNIPFIPSFELVAVCDRIGEKAERVARQYGAGHWFTDVEAMLDRTNPQGVCVCGPAEMHYEVGMQVLRRGIPVFLEKPPTPLLAQAEDLAQTAREKKTWGMVGFMKRFAPANLIAQEFMRSQEFGRLSTVTLIHGCGPYDSLRRMLFFNAIHLIDLGRFFAGDVHDLTAYSFHDGGRTHAVSVAMTFASGAVGQLNCNSGHSWRDCFEQAYVSGSGSGILIDNSRTTQVMSPGRRFAEGKGLELYGWSGKYEVSGNMAGWYPSGHYTRGYWGEMNHFAGAVLGEEKPAPTLDDGVEAVRLIERILESAGRGQP